MPKKKDADERDPAERFLEVLQQVLESRDERYARLAREAAEAKREASA
ncbi:MAG TPA: hypothetical protein VEA41_14260 [Salinarimonas sp.]|nr:hypothetical protein [Salinarimonas sp.]